MSGMCRFGLVHRILGRADWSTDHKHKMDMLTKSDFNYSFGHYCTQNTLMGFKEGALVRGTFNVDLASATGFHMMQILWRLKEHSKQTLFSSGCQHIRHNPLPKGD